MGEKLNIQLWQRMSAELDIVRPREREREGERVSGFHFTIVRNRLNHPLAQKTGFASYYSVTSRSLEDR